MGTNIRLYAYLNINNPLVAWEVAIGRIKSSCGINSYTYGTSVWMYSHLRRLALNGSDRRFFNELKLEQIRQQTATGSVSRLSGIYFFESEADAHAAVERWNIPDRKRYISPVDFSANHLARVDSEWITSYLASQETDWMARYWAGETLGIRPLTEVLASGIGIVRNKDLRSQACELIYKHHTTSTPLLSMACCGFAEAVSEEIAIVKPHLSVKDGVLQGTHFIDIRDLSLYEAELLQAMEECKKRGELLPMVIPDDGETFFKTPDFSELDFKLESPSAAELFASVHDMSLRPAG
jgi:hypothetical protein